MTAGVQIKCLRTTKISSWLAVQVTVSTLHCRWFWKGKQKIWKRSMRLSTSWKRCFLVQRFWSSQGYVPSPKTWQGAAPGAVWLFVARESGSFFLNSTQERLAKCAYLRQKSETQSVACRLEGFGLCYEGPSEETYHLEWDASHFWCCHWLHPR